MAILDRAFSLVRAGGQGQDRTADLPLFRRSVAFCPPSRKWIISPAHPHFRWRGCQVLRHGHGTTSAAVCRGMPFCPCYSRVDLRPGPGLVLLCVGGKTPDSQGHLPPQPTRACSSRIAIPAATRRTGGPAGAGPHERFRSTNVRSRRAPPSHQHRPAQRQRTLRLPPIILQAAPVTLRPEARLRTAIRNACSASQSHAERDYAWPVGWADGTRVRIPISWLCAAAWAVSATLATVRLSVLQLRCG